MLAAASFILCRHPRFMLRIITVRFPEICPQCISTVVAGDIEIVSSYRNRFEKVGIMMRQHAGSCYYGYSRNTMIKTSRR